MGRTVYERYVRSKGGRGRGHSVDAVLEAGDRRSGAIGETFTATVSLTLELLDRYELSKPEGIDPHMDRESP